MKLSDLGSASFYEDPYPLYDEIRTAGPLVQIDHNALICGRHAIVEALLQDRRMGKKLSGKSCGLNAAIGASLVQMAGVTRHPLPRLPICSAYSTIPSVPPNAILLIVTGPDGPLLNGV